MEKIVLHTRQRKLLSILNEQKGLITGVELGNKIEVSDRTIRSDISELNKILNEINVSIEAIRGKGYILKVKDSTVLHKLIYAENSLLTQEDRVRYLVIRLIRAEEHTKIDELEDEMFVSRSTLEKDIRIVEEKYSKKRPYLKLLHKGNSIFFEDNEKSKRAVLNELFSREWDYNSEEGMNFRDSIFDSKVFDIISENVKEILGKYEIKLNDEGLVYFVFAIAIAYLRIKAGHNLTEEVEEINDDHSITKAIDELMDKLEAKLNISFNNLERNHFIFLLLQKRIFNMEHITRKNILEYVDGEYIKIVEQLINDIKKEYLLDFTNDDELYIGLALHICKLKNKLKYEYEGKSPTIEILKNKYPLAFEMALIFRKHFKNKFYIDIEENELSYIAAYLGSAARRFVSNKLSGEISIAILSHLNYSTFELLKSKLEAIYGKTIKIIGPFSVYEKEKIIKSNARLILSTVKLQDLYVNSKDVIVISPFLEDRDTIIINDYIDKIKRDFVHPKLPEKIIEYFNEDLFFYGLNMNSKDEVLTFLSNELLKNEYVGIEFAKSVYEREKISSTAFESGIAMPRPLSNCSCYKTIISVVILKKPILWDGQKVKCIFLLSIKENDKKYLIRFFDLVVESLSNKFNIEKIMEANTFDKFAEIIR
jgi:Transcriptional antiterminator